MNIDPHEIETIVLAVGKGVAFAFPVTAPIVGALSVVLAALDAAGAIPTKMPSVMIEQITAQTAGIEAARSSIATEIHSLGKTAEPVTPLLVDAPIKFDGGVLLSTVKS